LAKSVECMLTSYLTSPYIRESVREGDRGRLRKRWLDFTKDIWNSQGLSLKDAFRATVDR